jgi:hypothetical protein
MATIANVKVTATIALVPAARGGLGRNGRLEGAQVTAVRSLLMGFGVYGNNRKEQLGALRWRARRSARGATSTMRLPLACSVGLWEFELEGSEGVQGVSPVNASCWTDGKDGSSPEGLGPRPQRASQAYRWPR